MNTKQWAWLYGQIKAFFRKHEGRIPDETTAIDIMCLCSKVMSVSNKERQNNPDMDAQIRNIFYYLFDTIHSLAEEGKVL